MLSHFGTVYHWGYIPGPLAKYENFVISCSAAILSVVSSTTSGAQAPSGGTPNSNCPDVGCQSHIFHGPHRS